MISCNYSFNIFEKCNMCQCDSTHFKMMGRRLNTSQGLFPSKRIGITTSILKCKKCSLIFSNPQPIPNRFEDHYGIDPEIYWDVKYFKPNELQLSASVEKAKLYGGINGKILDVGCGLGMTMRALLESGLDVYGFEGSSFFVEYAKSKNNIPEERIKLQTLEIAEYPENTFDYVLFGAVLEHLYDPSESLKKVLRWTKPGGRIEIEVPNSRWLIHKIINLIYKLQCNGFVANLSPMHKPYHLFEFDVNSFAENGKINGYKILNHWYYVAPTYLPKIFDKVLRFAMNKTNTGMQLIVVLEKNNN